MARLAQNDAQLVPQVPLPPGPAAAQSASSPVLAATLVWLMRQPRVSPVMSADVPTGHVAQSPRHAADEAYWRFWSLQARATASQYAAHESGSGAPASPPSAGVGSS